MSSIDYLTALKAQISFNEEKLTKLKERSLKADEVALNYILKDIDLINDNIVFLKKFQEYLELSDKELFFEQVNHTALGLMIENYKAVINKLWKTATPEQKNIMKFHNEVTKRISE